MTHPPVITVLLLAAGLSRRMGSANKLLLPFQGKTILETTLDHLINADIGEILVVTGHESAAVAALLQHKNVRCIENPHYAEGMTASIQAGIAAAPEHSAGYMICLADMPLLLPAEYRQMADFFKENLPTNPDLIVQPTYQGQRGNPVLFSKMYKKEILENTVPEGCKPIVQRHLAAVKHVEMPSGHLFFDVDNPETYQLLLTANDAAPTSTAQNKQ